MPKKGSHLTPSEKRIATWLARGKSTAQICAELHISPATFRVHCTNIRRKVGTDNLRTVNAAMLAQGVQPSLSPAQREVLVLVANNWKYRDIARTLEIKLETVMNHVSMGCKRIGLIATRRTRPKLLQAYLSKLERAEEESQQARHPLPKGHTLHLRGADYPPNIRVIATERCMHTPDELDKWEDVTMEHPLL